MDYMNTNVSLQLNRAATGVEQSFPDGRNGQTYERKVPQSEKKEEELTAAEQKLVSLSISLEGLQRMKISEKLNEVSQDELASEDEIELLKKRMEGLSSQAVNGNFSMADRVRFQTEIKFLADELGRINNGGVSFSKASNSDISLRIDALTKEMNQQALHRRPASAFYFVNNQQKLAATYNKLNIAI